MARKQGAPRILVGSLDITTFVKSAGVPIDQGLRTHFAETRRLLDRVDRIRKQLEDAMKALENQERMDAFTIEQLMSAFNQMEAAASELQKKRDDTANAIIHKVG